MVFLPVLEENAVPHKVTRILYASSDIFVRFGDIFVLDCRY